MSISKNITYIQIFAIVSLSCLFFAQTANALSIVATISVGSSPLGIEYDSAKGEIFVSNNADGTVSVISDVSNEVVATITVRTGPNGIAYDSAKGEMFVANAANNTVSVISDVSNEVVATITVGTNPSRIAYDSVMNEIFVSNVSTNTVSVISDASNTVVATIPVGSSPNSIAYDSVKGEMFVTNTGTNTVSVISDATNTVVATVTVGTNPFGIAYDSAKAEIFVSNYSDGTVSVISDVSNTVVAIITVGTNPIGIAYDSATDQIFVSNNADGTVSVISDASNEVVTTISVGSGPGSSPFGIAYDSAKAEIFVANNVDNTVSVIPNPVSSIPHDVTIHHPPSLGNDYNYHYPDGLTINYNNVGGTGFKKTFDITKYGSSIPQQVLQIGQSANFTFKMFDERGPNTISHVGMYIHFKGDAIVTNSDTSIVWDKHDGIKVTDPEKFFSDTAISEHYDNNFAYLSVHFTPAKTMTDSSILMRIWDDKLASIDLPIWGAIIVVDPNAPVQVKKVPSNQYGDYNTLVGMLDSDGYQMPTILHKIRGGSDLSSAVDVYWIYDKGTDKLVMVETFKDGTMIGNTVFNLLKKPVEPTLTDHDYVDMPIQNNRFNPEQEKIVMHQEEVKAEKILESMHVGTNHVS